MSELTSVTTVLFTNDTDTPYIPAFKTYSPVDAFFGYKFNGYYYPTANFPPGSTSPPPTGIPPVLPGGMDTYDVSSSCCDSKNPENLDKPCVPGCSGCYRSDLRCTEMYLLTEDMSTTLGPIKVNANVQTTINASQFFEKKWSPMSPSTHTQPLSPLSPSTPIPAPTAGTLDPKTYTIILLGILVGVLLVVYVMKN